MNIVVFREKIKKQPDSAGVYLFKDNSNNPLYIGKASNLKNRLSNYLHGSVKIKTMLSKTKNLEIIKTESAIEALILESLLIKKFRPQFNVTMRDDKQYFYVGFTDEKFPKIFLTHQPQTSGATPRLASTHFIGPFTEGSALKSTLKYLRRIFPFCTCTKTHHNFCLNYHINKCLGYCCLKTVSPKTIRKISKEYQRNVDAIKAILSGKKVSLIKKIEKEMGQLARKGELKKAIELRNKISSLKKIFENARIIKNSDTLKAHRSGLESLLKTQKPIIKIEGYDISNIGGTHAVGSMVVFIHGQPNKSLYRKFKIKQTNEKVGSNFFHDREKNTTSGGDTGMLKEILERRFQHNEWVFPDLILVDGGKGQINTILKTLAGLKIKIPIIGISKDKRHMGHQLVIPEKNPPHWRIIPLTKLSPIDKNLLLTINSEAHRFAINYHRKLHRKLFN